MIMNGNEPETSRARRFARCAVVVVALVAGGRAEAEDEPLIGLWMYQWSSTPGLHGALTVRTTGTNWRAALSGSESRFEVTGNDIRFVLPGGSFRGTLTGKAIDGFWLQPMGDPRGTGQRFATPLSLAPAGRGVWRGTVRPLDDRFTLYVKIYRNADGALVGAIRNPERNSNGGVSLYRVSRDGNQVRLSQKPAPDAPEIVFEAMLLRSPDRLRMQWPDLGGTVELARRSPSQAPRFFPRPPGEPRYAYRKPPVTGDGWDTARARDAGLDEAELTRLVQKLLDADPSLRGPSLIHSLLVARRGKLVLEEYFFGHDRDTPHDLRSAGKTFASVMLGAAMLRGTRIAPDTKVYELMAGLGPFAHPDPRKAQITLAHLLTHSAGLACDDNDDASPGREDLLSTQRLEPNWWKYTLDLPVAHAPGAHYAYCSANINLVGGALTTATATWLPELFDRTIARPLQFGRYHWNLDPRHEGYLGGGAYVRPRDLLKLGQAYLDGGVWRGQRIVDADWVTRSTSPHIEISPATTGLADEAFQNAYIKGAEGHAKDGYAWHLVGIRSRDRAYREFDASGNGGQLLLVIPELELVVVLTGGNYRQGGIWNRWRDNIVGAELIPAIKN
jgi:CubicO group peptidase (beta-lactamase class C family)